MYSDSKDWVSMGNGYYGSSFYKKTNINIITEMNQFKIWIMTVVNDKKRELDKKEISNEKLNSYNFQNISHTTDELLFDYYKLKYKLLFSVYFSMSGEVLNCFIISSEKK